MEGNPGAGKTILASFAVEELQEDESLPPPTVCFNFFSSEGNGFGSDHVAAYRALLSQILALHRHDRTIIDIFTFCKENRSSQRRASTIELLELLRLCCSQLERVCLVLDGIDECSDSASLINNLRVLSSSCSIKLLFFSRVSVVSLTKRIKPASRLQLDRSTSDQDIHCYLLHQLENMVDEGLLDPAPLAKIAKQLVRGADGMFLWAKLMVNYLNSPALTPSKRLSTIQEVLFPEGLEKMYDRILALIATRGATERHLAGQIFSWIIYSKTQLSLQQLYDAVHSDEEPRSDVESDHTFMDTIGVICGSLVECRAALAMPFFAMPDTGDTRVLPDASGLQLIGLQFIHFSVLEHFKQEQSKLDSEWLELRQPDVHYDLAERCLRRIFTLEPQENAVLGSFTAYAVTHWISHLADSTEKYNSNPTDHVPLVGRLAVTLAAFLQDPKRTTSWLFNTLRCSRAEPAYLHLTGNRVMLSTETTFPQTERLMQWVRLCMERTRTFVPASSLHNILDLTTRFCSDVQELGKEWGDSLRDNPLILWDEAPAFRDSQFLYSNNLIRITKFAPVSEHPDMGRSSRALCNISTTSTDFQRNLSLSIWPSKLYEDRWQDLKSNDPINRVHDVCSDWVAKLEMWSIDRKECIANISIPLDESEVWLHMRQSLREKDIGQWITSFPIVFGPDAKSLIVLRTLYVFYNADCTSKPLSYHKTLINVDITDSHRSKWAHDLVSFDPQNGRLSNTPLKSIYRDWYSYSFEIHPNGRFLLFKDYLILNYLAIYEIENHSQPRAKLLGWKCFPIMLQDNLRVGFHPTASIVAISTTTEVSLWNFQAGE